MARKQAKRHPKILRFEELEQRVLFSADLVPGSDDLIAQEQTLAAETSSDVELQRDTSADSEAIEQAAAETAWELVFINENVVDYQQLISSLQYGEDNPILEIVVLDSERDGIEQVSEVLSEHQQLAAVHFISHGSDGQINLGDSWLTETSLQQNSSAIAGWGEALNTTGDLLFYGCNIAGDSGQTLLADMAKLTGADVTASNDLTGSSELGGDWDLEYLSGTIETETLAATAQHQDWSHLLAPPVVTTDGPAVNYSENDPATVIDPTTTVTDVDSPNFSLGNLTVTISSGGSVNDQLTFVENNGVVRDHQDNLFVDGMNIGRISGGVDGTTLEISWNVLATPERVQIALRQIGYHNNFDDPSTTPRIVDFVITDGDGDTSNIAQQTINIVQVNDAPTTSTVTLAAIAEDSGGRLITQAELLSNATDNDGDLLTAANLTLSAGSGTLIDNGDGTWNFTPAANDDSAVTFGYTISDATDNVVGSTTLDILPLNDAPFFTSVASTVMDEIGGYNYTIITSDIDDNQLTISAPILPNWLTLIDNSDGTASLTGTPTSADGGDHSVSLHINDGTAISIQDFTINVAVSAIASASDIDEIVLTVVPAVEAPASDPLDDPFQVDTSPVAVTVDEEDAAQQPSGQADNTDSGQVATSTDQTTEIAPATPITGYAKSIDMLSTTHDRNSPAIAFNTALYRQLGAGHYSDFTAVENLEQLKAPRIAQPNDVNQGLNIEIETSGYDQLRKEIDESFSSEQEAEITQAQLVTITTASFSVGIVSYFLRAGALFASLMSSVPLWRGFDPIAIFPGAKTKQKTDRNKKAKEKGESKAETFFDGEEQ